MSTKIAGKIVSHFSLNGNIFTSTVEIDGEVIFTEKHTDSITLAYNTSEKLIEEEYIADENTTFSIENGSVLKEGKLTNMPKFALSPFFIFPMVYYADLFDNNIKRKSGVR